MLTASLPTKQSPLYAKRRTKMTTNLIVRSGENHQMDLKLTYTTNNPTALANRVDRRRKRVQIEHAAQKELNFVRKNHGL